MRHWILIVAAVLAVVLGVVLLGPWRGGADGASAVDPAAAAARLELIEQQAQAALENKRDLQPLVDDLRALVEDAPSLAGAHRLLGLLLIRQGTPEAAYAHLREAAAVGQTPDAEVLSIMGSLALKAGDTAAAREHYEQAVAADGTNSRIRLQLAHVLMEAGETAAAREHLERVVRLDASQHKAYAMLATLAAEDGDLPRAIELVGRAIDRLPTQDIATRTMYARQQAEYWTQQGNPEQALASLRLLPIEVQFSPAISEQMAGLWSAMGEPAKAARHYEQAATLYPALIQAPERAAQWYEKAGRPEDARRMRAMARRGL